jgi:hypothetical protein
MKLETRGRHDPACPANIAEHVESQAAENGANRAGRQEGGGVEKYTVLPSLRSFRDLLRNLQLRIQDLFQLN